MEPNPASNRKSNMQRAIANEMTRTELGELLSDPKSKKEFFELMKLKYKIGFLDANRNYTDPFRSDEKKRNILDSRNLFLAAACILLLSGLAFYFRFFTSNKNEFEIMKSVTTGQCNVTMNQEEIILKSGKNSFCDYTIEGELGLTLRILPDSVFSASKKGNEVNLNLSSGTVLFTTNKKKISLKVRSNVKTISSELLGTTLVLIADKQSKKYQIIVLDGAIRVSQTDSLKPKVDVLAGYSVLKNETSPEFALQEVEITKIDSNEFTKYQALSEDSQRTLSENFTNHSEETNSLLKSDLSNESIPIYRITLKNKEVLLGTLEENDRFYILKDKKGNRKEIKKDDVVEIELIPSEH
ncbi:LIMLP_03685 family anti-sigma factor [Leptospira santarosai]|uniref:LIMLP_03685 family anti-sigma factor n=1 Tax=Leptospira santarosai TaxID=28183 RepID=UPI0024AF2CFB|nr:FecR domain-containing protein [Leptospira santarosai]MDI7188266.1 FecR domain-containing protein [Leptospira santarosai]